MVTLLLIITNLVVYLLELAYGGQAACQEYGLIPANFAHSAQIGPLFSSLFFHDPSSLLHLGGNMVFLAVFGPIVERALGHFRFLGLYLLAGAWAGLIHVLVDPSATDALVGASGAIFGIMTVAAVIRPRLLPFVVLFIGLNVWHAFVGADGSVSFGAHLGGFFAGLFFAIWLRLTGDEALEVA